MFATFNFSIILLAAQVNRKIESDIKFGGALIKLETGDKRRPDGPSGS